MKDDLRQLTVETYDRSAAELAVYFRGIGPRVKYIDLAFKLTGEPKDARVLEIGCGDGRDAKEIANRCKWFLGFDISTELIKLARAHVPDAEFEVADAASFEYPDRLDVVFAFASLLHLDKNEVADVLRRVHASLRTGGIFFISLKLADEYQEMLKEDKFGKRLFYLYNPELITELAGDGYEVADNSYSKVGQTDWFEIALRKV